MLVGALVSSGALSPLKCVARLVLAPPAGSCWLSGCGSAKLGSVGLCNRIAILPASISGKELLDALNKILISTLLRSLFGPVIDFQIELQLTRATKLSQQDVSEGGFLGLVVEAGNNGFPVMNERTEIIPTELDLKQILNGVKRARFFVGLKVMLKHEQNLPPPADRPIGCGL